MKLTAIIASAALVAGLSLAACGGTNPYYARGHQVGSTSGDDYSSAALGVAGTYSPWTYCSQLAQSDPMSLGLGQVQGATPTDITAWTQGCADALNGK